MLRIAISVILLFIAGVACCQSTTRFADSIRRVYEIPELSYAVISADSVYEIHTSGTRKLGSKLPATLNDRFRIGSNTKAITGYIAALLVKEGKLCWNTRFFDLFPELKEGSRVEYRKLTLLDLLTFRARLFSYTYTYPVPVKGQFTGDEGEQRFQFTRWFFQQPPVEGTDSIHFSNLGYIAAGLMLEKVAGKPYKQLVLDFGEQLGIDFAFGQPNSADQLQTWGHSGSLKPEAPTDNYKLNWLLPAGNINATRPGYLKFIQLQLKGLRGGSDQLTQQEFNFLHYGLPRFSVGWFADKDEQSRVFSYNIGNPGTFLSKVYVFKDQNVAFILFSNAQTDMADEGMDVLYEALKKKYL